ncbi:hypothetical protein ACHAXM_000085 [Skeletonema potamos]
MINDAIENLAGFLCSCGVAFFCGAGGDHFQPSSESAKRFRFTPGLFAMSILMAQEEGNSSKPEPLSYVANFLATPSRALFAVALDESSDSLRNERSYAIAGNQWDVLDFGEIEKELTVKLTDDHIERVLQCIDAVNKVKRLKLTNCVNITGAGLDPLRGSTVIEQIDLSLVGEHQRPFLDPDPLILAAVVLPILDSIFEREGYSLKHLQFPHVWRRVRSEFSAFLGRCNQKRELPLKGDDWFVVNNPQMVGTQNNTCCVCLNNYCIDCMSDEVDDRYMIDFCGACHRNYCIECSAIELCESLK